MMTEPVRMERGFEYHANFIYNVPKLKYNSNEDCTTSLQVVKHAVDIMARWGFKRTYYHDRDALPGGNIFDEFFKSVKKSRFTVVIVTKGFINDCWTKYKSQAAFCKLMEKDLSKRFIAFYVNVEEHEIPEELCLNHTLQFGHNWREHTDEWAKLKNVLYADHTRPIQDQGSDPYPETYNPEQQNVVVTSRQNYSGNQNDARLDGRYRQSSTNTRNPGNRRNLSGLQDSNPADPRMLIDLATDSSDTPTQSLSQPDVSQSFGFTVNEGQNTQHVDHDLIYQREPNTDTQMINQTDHNIGTETIHQREYVSSSNSSPTTQYRSLDMSQSNTTDINQGVTSEREIRPSPTRPDNQRRSLIEVSSISEDMTETSGRYPQQTSSIRIGPDKMAVPGRSSPDGEVGTNQNNVQRVDSTDTNPKDLVGGDDEIQMSSLDQPDVETDTRPSNNQVQSPNIRHGSTRLWSNDDYIQSDQQAMQLVRPKDELFNQPNSEPDVPSLNPTSMQNKESLTDEQTINCKREEDKSPPQENNSDSSLQQLYSLVTGNRYISGILGGMVVLTMLAVMKKSSK